MGDASAVLMGMRAYRLPDGKELRIEGITAHEAFQKLVKHDEPDVVFYCGNGEHAGWIGNDKSEEKPPLAVRFRLEGETLKAQRLWHGPDIMPGQYNGRIGGSQGPAGLYHDGKFYHREGAILDALTGKLKAGRIFKHPGVGETFTVPKTGHMLQVAGGYVFGLEKAKDGDEMQIFTVDGKPVATRLLPVRPVTPAQKEMCANTIGGLGFGEFSYSRTFTFAGNDLFVRSLSSVICIGPRP